MGNKIYSTKQLSSKCSLTKKTIRHYNKMELIVPRYIDENGYWYFNEEDLKRIDKIQKLKSIGLTLKEIKTHIDGNSELLKKLVASRTKEIHAKMKEMKEMKDLMNLFVEEEEDVIEIAIDNSIKKDHVNWVNNNLLERDLEYIQFVFSGSEGMLIHDRMIVLINKLKVDIENTKNQIEFKNQIDCLFSSVKLDRVSLEEFIHLIADLSASGPEHSKMLNREEVNIIKQLFIIGGSYVKKGT